MLNCKEVVRLISSEDKLSFIQKTELKMHLLICKHCSNYNRQMDSLSKGLKKIFSIKSEENREKIQELEKVIIDNLSKKK